MKTTILVGILVAFSLPLLSPAEQQLVEQITVDVEIMSEQFISGQTETNVSKSTIISLDGRLAKILVGERFATEVPKYEEKTKQTGEIGISVEVTPISSESTILLKGIAHILEKPTLVSLKENGAVATQSAQNIHFSIKIKDGVPFELEPIKMPDGSKLTLIFTASKTGTSAIPAGGSGSWKFGG